MPDHTDKPSEVNRLVIMSAATDTADQAPYIVSNPEGVLRAIGSFKDDPMLDEWEQALKEWRELQCVAAENET